MGRPRGAAKLLCRRGAAIKVLGDIERVASRDGMAPIVLENLDEARHGIK